MFCLPEFIDRSLQVKCSEPEISKMVEDGVKAILSEFTRANQKRHVPACFTLFSDFFKQIMVTVTFTDIKSNMFERWVIQLMLYDPPMPRTFFLHTEIAYTSASKEQIEALGRLLKKDILVKIIEFGSKKDHIPVAEGITETPAGKLIYPVKVCSL